MSQYPITPYSPGQGAMEAASPRNRWLAFFMALFFGYWGLHRFYVGKFWTGLLMFMTAGGFGLWWFVDTIWILAGSFRDAEGRVLGPAQQSYGALPPGQHHQHYQHQHQQQHLPPQPQAQPRVMPPRQPEADGTDGDLLADPLEEKFRELEREMKAKQNQGS